MRGKRCGMRDEGVSNKIITNRPIVVAKRSRAQSLIEHSRRSGGREEGYVSCAVGGSPREGVSSGEVMSESAVSNCSVIVLVCAVQFGS